MGPGPQVITGGLDLSEKPIQHEGDFHVLAELIKRYAKRSLRDCDRLDF